MNPVLPPLQDIGGVRIKDTTTPELALIGGCRSPFEPMAHRPFRHAHPLCHLSLRQALCTQGRHLVIAIITTGLPCLMSFLHMGRSTLLPCGYRGPRTGALFCGLLQLRHRSFSLTNFRTTVSKDLLRSEEHTSELQSPDHLVCRLLLEKKKHNATPHIVPVDRLY